MGEFTASFWMVNGNYLEFCVITDLNFEKQWKTILTYSPFRKIEKLLIIYTSTVYVLGRDRSKYLLIKTAKIIAMTCTHAALRRRDLVELGFKVWTSFNHLTKKNKKKTSRCIFLSAEASVPNTINRMRFIYILTCLLVKVIPMSFIDPPFWLYYRMIRILLLDNFINCKRIHLGDLV